MSSQRCTLYQLLFFLGVPLIVSANIFEQRLPEIETIVRNPFIYNRYLNCALNRGPCDSQIQRWKEHVRPALENDCKDCTEDVRNKSFKALKYLYKYKIEDLKELAKVYDKDGENWKRLEAKYGNKNDLYSR